MRLLSGAFIALIFLSSSSYGIEKARSDMCNKKIVVLGEDNSHGSKITTELKSKIMMELIEQCGFTEIFFESSIYDFVNLRKLYDKKKIGSEYLADSIGGIWSLSKSFQPLIEFLHKKSTDGKVKIYGMDFQIGGATEFYSQTGLVDDLIKFHPKNKNREICERNMRTLTQWKFNKNQKFDHNFRVGLMPCIDSIVDGAKTKADEDALIMAESFKNYLVSHGKEDQRRFRSTHMFENFSRFHNKKKKAIIWTASTHGVRKWVGKRGETKGIHNLGGGLSSKFKDDLYVLSFAAKSGSFGKKPFFENQIATEKGSIEDLYSKSAPTYLSKDKIKNLGEITSNLVSFKKPLKRTWHEYIDGLIIIAKEEPMDQILPPKPRQK